MLPDGIQVIGWDIWNGGYVHATVPRAYADTVETLLGKRGTILDRHSLAAIDAMGKLRNLRSRITVVKVAWDEIAAMWQLIARGIVGYAPTVGNCPRRVSIWRALLSTTSY